MEDYLRVNWLQVGEVSSEVGYTHSSEKYSCLLFVRDMLWFRLSNLFILVFEEEI